MKIWVDDLRDPKAFGRPDWHWVKSNTEAIRLLDTCRDYVEEVSLDYDICHTVPGDGAIVKPVVCEETFEATARFLTYWVLLYGKKGFPVTLHTSSTVGADRMDKLFQAYGDLFTVTHKYGGKL